MSEIEPIKQDLGGEIPKVPVRVYSVWPVQTVYSISLIHSMPGEYQLQTDEDTIGVIKVRYDDLHKVIIDCSKCPDLLRGRQNPERVLELTPNGYGRQRIGSHSVLEVESESQKYKSKTSNSKRNWQHQRRYRRWLAATYSERYRPMGFCH